MPFGHEVLANDPNFGVIGLVPCAIGGTKIIDWEVALVITNNWLKELMRPNRVVAKSKRLCGIKRSLILNKKTDDRLYKRRLQRLFTNIRADLNSPNLQIIQVWFYFI